MHPIAHLRQTSEKGQRIVGALGSLIGKSKQKFVARLYIPAACAK